MTETMPEIIHLASKGALSVYTDKRMYEPTPGHWDTEYTRSDIHAALERDAKALYEVLGYDNTNFDASLVYSQKLDTKVVWEARLVDGY